MSRTSGVAWSTKARAAVFVAVPALAALSHWSFVTAERPSAAAGALFGVMAAVAALACIAAVRLRIDVDGDGLRVRTGLGASRRVPFDEITRVELIAQHADGNTIVRSRAGARHEAFHVVIHTKGGRVNVNRWMAGVDGLLDALTEAGTLERTDAPPAFQPERPLARATSVAAKTLDGTQAAFVGLAIVMLSWVAGFMIAGKYFFIVDGLIVDATILALVPVLAFVGLLRGVRVLRARRFGPELARVPITVKDAVYLYGTMLFAGPLTYEGVREVASDGLTRVSGFFLVVGLLFVWFVVRDLRALVRDP